VLVESGVVGYKNIQKVMQPFRKFFVLLRINFGRGPTRAEAQNRVFWALNCSGSPLRSEQNDASTSARSSRVKPPYRNRRYQLAKDQSVRKHLI
jgi:hypothetical protein